MRMSRMDVVFEHTMPVDERWSLFERFGMQVISNDGKRTYVVEVPDGTQWEWANRLMATPGVRMVTYSRPRNIADN